MNNILYVIRDAEGNIQNEFDTKEEAEKELAYYGEEYEVTSASVDEVFEHVFGCSPDIYVKGLPRF